MSNFSKLIILIIIGIAGWWGYDTFMSTKNVTSEILQKKESQVIVPKEDNKKEEEEQQPKKEEISNNSVYIYLLTADKSGSQYIKPVKRPLPPGQDKLTYAVTQLLEGPNGNEKSKGIYTEVPEGSKLIAVTQTDNKIIINLNGGFGYGGGSDSIYSRMRQLIKTSLANSKKPVYLHLDGKQVDVLGGEGITFSQPLSEKSLDE